MIINRANKILTDESGQGITEYGAVLSFIAALIIVTISAGSGPLQGAIKNSFSVTASSLTQLANNAS